MRRPFLISTTTALMLTIAVFTAAALAQNEPMPKEDVVDVPAIGDGLCVSNLFQSNMVLQRDQPISIWGWAEPGKRISVTFSGTTATGTAGDDRRWQVALPALAANENSQSLTISSGEKSIELANILVGDVWVLGGQSNMEFELAKVENGELEIQSAHYPKIRILTVPYGQGPELNPGFARLHEWSGWFGRHFRKGDWDVCSPKVARELSAIGFVFARRVHLGSQVPIGVIDASRGGTTVETWTPLTALRQLDSAPTQAMLADFDQQVEQWDAQADLNQRIKQHEQWTQRQIKDGKEIPDDRRQPPDDLRPGPLGNHNFPGHCYAGMIAPLEGLSIKGAIFHQGYNNAFNGSVGVEMYRDVMPLMIESWRQAFGNPELPFGIISLCTDGYPQTLNDYCEKMHNAGIEIRAAQYETYLALQSAGDENVGFASTYDLRRRWYHPQLKIPAGERIARWALATEYGLNRIQWKPPMLKSMEVRDDSIVLTMDRDVGDPQDGKIVGFAIAGEDRKFHPADANYAEQGKDDRGRVRYNRKQLVLTSPMVSSPIHYRYAWGRNPLANLQATGNLDLPFATQRSDDWIMEQVPAGVLGDEITLPISRGDRGKLIQALREQDRQRRLENARRTLQADKG